MASALLDDTYNIFNTVQFDVLLEYLDLTASKEKSFVMISDIPGISLANLTLRSP